MSPPAIKSQASSPRPTGDLDVTAVPSTLNSRHGNALRSLARDNAQHVLTPGVPSSSSSNPPPL